VPAVRKSRPPPKTWVAELRRLESPQSNGMAEAFVRTIKRDYVRVNPTPDAKTVIRSLSKWFDHYNQLHPHRALGYRSPREFIADRSIKKPMEPVSGN
jgi:putative transposase